jgi:hypothetical protein
MRKSTLAPSWVHSLRAGVSLICMGALSACVGAPHGGTGLTRSFPLSSTESLRPRGVVIESVHYDERRGVLLRPLPQYNGDTLAVLDGVEFTDGTLELEVAGKPQPNASAGARGFIGIAFHVQPAGAFECFYLRPTNGRASDQLRRNHTTQYIAEPQYPWPRLRSESPGIYESYVDVEPGVWTPLRVEVQGGHAALYVNDARQPALIVEELGPNPRAGAVGLWIGDETEGYFRNLRITPAVAAAHSPPASSSAHGDDGS